MDSADSGMEQIEIDGLILTVDRETAQILQTDPEARKSYSTQIRQQLFGREQKIDNDIPVPVWKTSKNQTDRDREATRFFLDLRKKFDKEFADKTTNKNSVWARIAKIMNDNEFFVGDGIDGREKCRQKFSNLQASYIKYVDKRKLTGEGKIVKPPFYDELEDILGDKHKIVPILALDSLPIENTEMEKVEEKKNISEDGQQPSTSNRFSEVKHSVKPNENEILLKIYELNKENQKINEINFQNMMAFLNKESEQRHKQIMSLIENMAHKSKKRKRSNEDEDSD